jgi:FixJ family two-component response regulator
MNVWLADSRGVDMPAQSHQLPTGRQSEASIVYIIDDDATMRRSLCDLLESVELSARTFASWQEFLAYPKLEVPSCLILDVRLRGESGLQVQQEAQRLGVRMPILFMTAYGDIQMSVRAMKAGALDFFPKPFHDQEMLDAVAEALAKDSTRLEAERASASLRAAYDHLTPREQAVMAYVAAGLMNKQIAAEMNLSEITVKVHRGQTMKKMNARTVVDLVRQAEALGLPLQRARQP